MSTERWTVGDITITKIEETIEWAPLELFLQVFPEASRAELAAVDWLRPSYYDGESVNALVVHSLVVSTPTHNLVVDTGIGNAKKRILPGLSDLDTDFLERFEQSCACDRIDVVLCTHLHVDHVGWNTTWSGERWVPTFPNARYCFVREEFEHWRTFVDNPSARDAYTEFGYSLVDAEAVFQDSLAPVEEAGLIEWVEPGSEIVPGVSLLGTQGHTPGHVSVLIEDAGKSAVITGDLLHAQVQVAYPHWAVEMDTDRPQAVETRKAFLETFADTGTLVIGTHFGTPAAGYVAQSGDGFRLVPASNGAS